MAELASAIAELWHAFVAEWIVAQFPTMEGYTIDECGFHTHLGGGEWVTCRDLAMQPTEA